MTIKEMKTTWQSELMGEIREAREWREKWIGENDPEKRPTYESLCTKTTERVAELLELARQFGWLTKEQKLDILRDALDAIHAD